MRRALIADDHPIVVDGLRRLLESRCEVVGTVGDGRALVEAARALVPDVIVVDVGLPLLNGVEAARLLRDVAPRARVVFLSMYGDGATVVEAFRAGAAGYLVKSGAPTELLTAIDEVLAGRCYVTPHVAREVVERALGAATAAAAAPDGAAGPAPALSDRQREVLQLVVEGRSTKEVAGVLGVAVKTVEFHKTRLMRQLGCRTTVDLVRVALSRGLVRA
jgi:DNA-binding NarL/FixJ family response regulator